MKRKLRSYSSDSSLIQGDLSMNLFIILLTILAILVFSSMKLSTTGFEVRFEKDNDDDQIEGVSRGWSPIQPIHHRLLVRESIITLFNPTPIAITFARGEENEFILRGNDKTRLPSNPDNDPTAYVFSLGLSNKPVPKELTYWSTELESPDSTPRFSNPAANDFFSDENYFDIFIYPGSEKVAWELSKFLTKKRKIFFLINQSESSKNFIRYRRGSDLYTFESSYK